MKKIVTFGEIMLRIATPDHQPFSQAVSFNATFGGGEANMEYGGERVGIYFSETGEVALPGKVVPFMIK